MTAAHVHQLYRHANQFALVCYIIAVLTSLYTALFILYTYIGQTSVTLVHPYAGLNNYHEYVCTLQDTPESKAE